MLPKRSAAAAPPRVVNPVGGNIKTVAQSVRSTFSIDSSGPVIGSLGTAEGLQNGVKRVDGKTNAAGNTLTHGKK